MVQSSGKSDKKPVQVEIELFVEPDGTVVFADLAAEMIPIAQKLNPDDPLVCDILLESNEKDGSVSA